MVHGVKIRGRGKGAFIFVIKKFSILIFCHFQKFYFRTFFNFKIIFYFLPFHFFVFEQFFNRKTRTNFFLEYFSFL